MSTLPQQQTIVQYVTNSSQMAYTFAFYAPLPTDIQVYYQASNAIPIPSSDILSLNSQYTVTYNSDPTTGGTITLLFTPTSGYYLTINRQVQASLTTNFALAQNFNGANLDAALDRLLLLIQQNLNYITQRNLSYVINTYLPTSQPYTQLPPLPQNYFWVGSGSGVVAAQIATVPSASVLQSQLANNSPGTDGARLVGYYDVVNDVATTVEAYLAGLLNQPVLNQPTINQPNIVGETSAAAIPAGSVGEVIQSKILFASSVNLPNNAATQVTSITLMPGNWDVWGNVCINSVTANITTTQMCINVGTPTIPDFSILAGTANVLISLDARTVPPLTLNVSTNTTVYLVAYAQFASGSATACGQIIARRRA